VEAEPAQPDLPIEVPLATRLPLRFVARPSAVPPVPSPSEAEAARLRQAMVEVLARLEELRVLVARAV
jgi:hypothetical protein